eukprot:1088567-Amphidinium_carterae.2
MILHVAKKQKRQTKCIEMPSWSSWAAMVRSFCFVNCHFSAQKTNTLAASWKSYEKRIRLQWSANR